MHIRDVCNKQCLLATFGVLLSVTGLIFIMFWTDMFYLMMTKEMALRPDSKSYEIWKVPPLPMSLDIYFFNWTNPEDFMNKSTKPIVQEVGPYRYTEKPEKVDIQWHPENASVSYRRKSMFFFDAEGSASSLDDNITALNIIALSAAGRAQTWNYIKQKSVSLGLSMYEQPIAITRTVSELLFEGYSDDMIDVAREFPIFGEEVPVIFDKFGWFYARNNTPDLIGWFNVYTGTSDSSKIGQMHTWNYETSTKFFDSECGAVKGSGGEFYPPQPNGTIQLFSAELCRYLTLEHTETVTIHGIEGYKFSGTPKTVDNGTKYPENKCFCGGKCLPSGVINIAACRFGTPIYMSFPHYFNGDPYYPNQVIGLNPSKEKHEFYMVLEPMTGVVLEAAGRFQINMLVQPTKNIALYERAPYVFMPLLWFEQKVTISEEMAADLKGALSIPTIGQICASVVLLIGLILLAIIPIEHVFRRKNDKESVGKKLPKGENEINIEKGPDASPLLEKKGQCGDIKFTTNGNINSRNSKSNSFERKN